MNAACRRFLATQIFLAILINAFLNGLGPWFFFGHLKMSSVPMYGSLSVAGDVIGTLFLLPFLVCLTLTLETYRQMKQGLRRGNAFAEHTAATTKEAARNALSRSFKLGALIVLGMAPLTIGTLHLLGISEIELFRFCIVKAAGTAALAAVLVPPVALRALADQSGQSESLKKW